MSKNEFLFFLRHKLADVFKQSKIHVEADLWSPTPMKSILKSFFP